MLYMLLRILDINKQNITEKKLTKLLLHSYTNIIFVHCVNKRD